MTGTSRFPRSAETGEVATAAGCTPRYPLTGKTAIAEGGSLGCAARLYYWSTTELDALRITLIPHTNHNPGLEGGLAARLLSRATALAGGAAPVSGAGTEAGVAAGVDAEALEEGEAGPRVHPSLGRN